MFRKRCVLILGELLLLTIAASYCTSNYGNVYADDNSNTDIVDEINVMVPVSCSFAEGVSGDNTYTATIHNNEYVDDIGLSTFKVYCNDKDGYSIYAVGYSNNTFGNTEMVYQGDEVPAPSNIITGTAISGSTSNWAMKMTPVAGTYAPTLENGFGSYRTVPNTYTKVATFPSQTDTTVGSSVQSTYAVFISPSQTAGTYNGKVKYTMVHPASEVPAQPQTTQSGKICYYANASDAEGTMGCQTIPTSGTTNGVSPTSATLLASNFSRTGYGFAGWSDKFDYATNNEAKFYGPQEIITYENGQYVGEGKGLSLYAVWVKSAGNLQDATKVTELCGTGTNALTTAPTDGTANLESVSALTDQRDNETYAIAKLADGKCWMIENLRLDNSATLTTINTNNPLNDGTNVTLKHSYSDTETYNTLSASQDPTTTAWCNSNSASCDDQSMLFTGNTTNRASSPTANGWAMYSYGNYYNWYSATAGNGTYSFGTNNNSVAGDLCPTGWHLPIGGRKANVDVSDFWKLSRATIGADPANFADDYFYYAGTPEGTDASNKMRAYPNNFVYSGNVGSGSVSNRGSYGVYWSSTAYSSNFAYHLYLASSTVVPGTGNPNKYSGRTVRCVVSGS